MVFIVAVVILELNKKSTCAIGFTGRKGYIMTGENFKRMQRQNPLKYKLERLEKRSAWLWDNYIEWLKGNNDLGEKFNFELELEKVAFEIENTKYLLRY